MSQTPLIFLSGYMNRPFKYAPVHIPRLMSEPNNHLQINILQGICMGQDRAGAGTLEFHLAHDYSPMLLPPNTHPETLHMIATPTLMGVSSMILSRQERDDLEHRARVLNDPEAWAILDKAYSVLDDPQISSLRDYTGGGAE